MMKTSNNTDYFAGTIFSKERVNASKAEMEMRVQQWKMMKITGLFFDSPSSPSVGTEFQPPSVKYTIP